MEAGTFHGGLTTMEWILETSIGVALSGAPVTARIDGTGSSPSNTVSTAAAMFTCTRLTGNCRGIQRPRSIFARSAGRRVGQGWVGTGESRVLPDNYKKNNT